MAQHFLSLTIVLVGEDRKLNVARILTSDMKYVCTFVVGDTAGSAWHDATYFIFSRNDDSHRLAGIEHHTDRAENDVELCDLACREFVNLTE